MSSSFTVSGGSLPSFHQLIAAAELGEPLQLSGAGWTGEGWPRGLFAKIADAATVPSAIDLTPERVDEHEAALLAALARTVPELRPRDVPALFTEARTRMAAGLDLALRDLEALSGHENECFGLASEVALVAGRGEAGTLLPRLREHIRPDAAYAECAITTFTAKYA